MTSVAHDFICLNSFADDKIVQTIALLSAVPTWHAVASSGFGLLGWDDQLFLRCYGLVKVLALIWQGEKPLTI